jgi:hypothetical protein
MSGVDTTTTVTHPDGTVVTVTTRASEGGVAEAVPPIVKDPRPRVLATGGAGFIGSHTVVELLGAGMAVVCVQPRPIAAGTRSHARGRHSRADTTLSRT